jgi:5'-nucleotidase
VNSFLASGGDNFRAFNNGTGKQDTGKVDLQAMVDYMSAFADEDPLPVDATQRSVGVSFPGDAPEAYAPDGHVLFDVSSWSMSTADDTKDTAVQVKLGDEVIGTATLNNAIGTDVFDEYGKASVDVVLPAGTPDGPLTLTLVGEQTGTEVPVRITVDDHLEEIQVLATNDFHGRLTRSPSSAEAGAAVLSGAVKQLREANPNTVFAAAGDLIGASTFESFIQDDKPTIDALNEAGLEVSSVGNHEFDKGYDDLVNRVMAEYDEDDNPKGGAEWKYIGANVRLKSNDSHAIPASWIKDFGDVQVGFVGAVTEDLPSLVSPAGIEDIKVTDIVDEANAEAEALTGEGADIVVLLVHEGAATTALSSATDDSAFGQIVNGVDADIDAIVSGHTHLAYNHAVTVPEWVTEGRDVTTRPVVSAGQYGYNLNKLVFSYDTDSDEVVGLDQSVVALQSCTAGCTGSTQTWSPNFTADPAVTSIVDAAVAAAETLGAQPLGEIGGGFNRAKLSNGTTENRGGESTLGNLVAEVQRWATEQPESGSAQIAFMNPGGLRADMVGTGSGAFPRTLTYKQAAVVQPFANTLVNMDLTGANIKLALEQQWQRDASNNVPSRPFLRLGISDGFKYTYDPAKAEGSRVTGMWLDGVAIDPAATYSVTVNSFLASGGDNFRAFNNGTGKQDTGKVDLQAMVDYMDEFGSEAAVPVDYTQRSVGVSFPVDAPASYAPGAEVAFAASSLAFSTAADTKDTNVTVYLGNQPLRTTGVTNTIGDAVFDEYGTAPVTFVVPAGTPAGPTVFRLVGNQTGTEVPVTVEVGQESAVSAGDDISVTWGQATSIPVEVTGNDGTVTGTVRLYEGETAIGDAVTLTDGAAALPVPAKALEPGSHTLRVEYVGNHPAASDEVVVTVAKATTTVSAADVTGTYGQPVVVAVVVGDNTATGTVEVRNGATVLGSAAVSGGTASVTLPAGSLEPGATNLTAAYAGDGHFEAGTDAFTATVGKATPTVSAGNVSLTYGKAGTVTVNVGPSGATGTVQVLDGSKVIGSAAVSDGVANVTLPARSLEPGSNALTAAYAGDARFAAGSANFTVAVAKAASSTTVKASPAKAKVKKTRVTLKITVSGPSGVAETGKVRVKVPGQGTKTVTLRAGKATLKLAKFTSTGTKTIRVDYLGSDLLKPSADTVKVKVVKK